MTIHPPRRHQIPARAPRHVLVVTEATTIPLYAVVPDTEGLELRLLSAGPADPLRAIADAVVDFGADEVLVATLPEDDSEWLAQDLVTAVCAWTGLPVAHVVAEPAPALAPA